MSLGVGGWDREGQRSSPNSHSMAKSGSQWFGIESGLSMGPICDIF
jgi:hypothetical protein